MLCLIECTGKCDTDYMFYMTMKCLTFTETTMNDHKLGVSLDYIVLYFNTAGYYKIYA